MIPVFEPDVGEEEIAAVVAAIRRGELSGTFGSAIPAFERAMADYVGVTHAVAVSSGTTALQLAVAAAGLGPGDEVLVSASTNIATALAAAHCGALPVPVDSEPDTWNLDLDRLEQLIGPRTKAVIPVHLYGHPVDMDRLMDIARRHRLLVIEDCAESHGATVRGRMTGSFGQMSCFSFYANKLITTGEGGMVLTEDAALAERLRLLRNLAFSEPRFKHEALGFNFRMTGFQAAMGVVQAGKLERIVAEKRRVAHTYDALLADVPQLQRPIERDWARNVYWMYGLVVRPDSGVRRADLLAALAADGIQTRTFFCPMNQQPCLHELPGFSAAPCPVADRLWESGFYIPSSPTLDEATLTRIADGVRAAVRTSSKVSRA